jgi:hypothetical protein
MDRDPNLYNNDPKVGVHDNNMHSNMQTDGMNTVHDRETRVYDRDTPRGSNTLAYLIGGLVLALGLLAFLFYDGNNSGDVSTTGSTATQTERSLGAGTPANPSTPAAPAAPARPAAPQ